MRSQSFQFRSFKYLILYFCFVNYFIKIYRRNIYGIIGTLVFHILLFSAFLLSDIRIKGKAKEEAILIEFPDMPQQEEIIPKNEEFKDKAANDNSMSGNISNVASNKLSREKTTKSAEEFLDNNYLKEVEAAKQLVSDVNKQLSKKTVDIDDIKMPVQTTEGMNPDSIKNVVYAGESNITYYLENRYHLSLPIPVYLSQGGGKVVVNIVVNRQGKVIQADPVETKNLHDDQIYLYAKAAALRTVFNADANAPAAQKGSIHYNFVAQ